MTLKRETFHQQIRQNRVRSLLLMAIVVAIFAVLAWFFGFYLVGDPANAVIFVPIGGIIAAVICIGALFRGDSVILGISRARQVSDGDEPQLLNVVRELALRATRACCTRGVVVLWQPTHMSMGALGQHVRNHRAVEFSHGGDEF
jgi:hypothetical protein